MKNDVNDAMLACVVVSASYKAKQRATVLQLECWSDRFALNLAEIKVISLLT